jgi:transposase InsO family protein
MKQRNPTWGCPHIADQINLAFGTSINKEIVRRILAQHHRPVAPEGGPSWLTFIGHMKDSLWSLDLFRCESIALRTYWVLVVMDQYTRRIIGFGIHAGVVDGSTLCRMFKQALRGADIPKYLSSDHDPLYRFHQWQANLSILGISEIKTVPYTPWSHPFIERLIGTIRRECLDQLLFWTATDLEMKLIAFKSYYNRHRSHAALKGKTPIETPESTGVNLKCYRWQTHCRGLFHTPIAA